MNRTPVASGNGSGVVVWSAADVLALAAVVGCISAFTEVALLGVAAFGLGRWTHLNPQIVWLAPATYSLLFVFLATLVLLAGRWLGRGRVVRTVAFLAAWLGGSGVLFVYQRLHRGAAMIVAAGVAVQFSWLVVRYPAVFRRWTRRLFAPAVLLVVLAFTILNGRWWWNERRALDALGPSPDGPNVLLVIWDTVRSKSLSVYGYERPTTPTLERLAADGATFDRAFSTAPWTTPSHASIFTGLYPPQMSADWTTPLDDEPATLAEVLSAAGYRTAGFTANRFATSRESGLSRGFSHYDDYHVLSVGDVARATALSRALVTRTAWRRRLGFRHPLGHKTAFQVDAEFFEWLASDDRPFFAFLNYFDAHSPYEPPAPFDRIWGPPMPDRNPWMPPGRSFTPRELQAQLDAYEASIAFLDHRLGLLVDELDRRGILENTIVIVTSDHGEEFGEHGVFTHGNSMYDAVLHVPLLLHWPAGIPRGVRTETFVSNRDVPATILDLLGLDEPRLPGWSLARFWSDAPSSPDSVVAAVERVTGNPPHYPVSRNAIQVLMVDPWKLIANGTEFVELYDLRRDPGETDDRAADLPDLRDRLESALRRRMRAWRGSRP